MQSKVDILFGITGQSLTLDCREGRPSSVVSVEVFEDTDGADNALSAVGAPSIEAVTTTLDGAAGAGETNPTVIPLTATTGLAVGRRFLISNALGQREWVDVAGISDGVSVIAQVALIHDYASGDDFVSTRIVVSLADAWVADESNVSNPLCPRPRYRIVWTYVVDGVTCRVTTFFDLTRYPFTHTVTAQDVDRLSRGWLFRLAGEDRVTAGQDVIEEAVLQVKLDLWEHGLAAYAQRNSDAVNELIRRKAVVLVHEDAFAHNGITQAQLDASTKAYWSRVENLIPKTTQQATEDGAGGQTKQDQLWRR